LFTKGLSDEEKKYVKLDDKGSVVMTEEFSKLPEDKQMALKAKFKFYSGRKLRLNLMKKTAVDKEKKMIEGRTKLLAGDVFGAKEDLLSYLNDQKKDSEHDEERYEQCREMLKQIALMELTQMTQRLSAMKESVNSRYNNVLVQNQIMERGQMVRPSTTLKTWHALSMLPQAMIQNGEVLTIEEAEAKLRNSNFL
jgi:hypothetical protein